jgi:hypothetical protein
MHLDLSRPPAYDTGWGAAAGAVVVAAGAVSGLRACAAGPCESTRVAQPQGQACRARTLRKELNV